MMKCGEIKMMKCVATCPELDHDNSPHCTCRSQSEMDDMYERYPDGCPVGNIPVWEEMRGDTMEQKALETLQGLLCDINPVEISSHFADDTLFSWLGAWRSGAEKLVALLLENEKCKASFADKK